MNRYQQAEGCPRCGRTEGVELTRTTSRVSAWKCTQCGMTWAVSVINPHLRGDYPAALAARVKRHSAARLILREVITLADKAPHDDRPRAAGPATRVGSGCAVTAICGGEVLPGSLVTHPGGGAIRVV